MSFSNRKINHPWTELESARMPDEKWLLECVSVFETDKNIATVSLE